MSSQLRLPVSLQFVKVKLENICTAAEGFPLSHRVVAGHGHHIPYRGEGGGGGGTPAPAAEARLTVCYDVPQHFAMLSLPAASVCF